MPILVYMASSALPLGEVRRRLSEIVADVERTHQRITVTKHGQAAAVLISPQDLAALEETLDILSTPGALEQIRESEAEFARGDFVTGEELAARYARG